MVRQKQKQFWVEAIDTWQQEGDHWALPGAHISILGCGSLANGTFKVADCAEKHAYICQMEVPTEIASKALKQLSKVMKGAISGEIPTPDEIRGDYESDLGKTEVSQVKHDDKTPSLS